MIYIYIYIYVCMYVCMYVCIYIQGQSSFFFFFFEKKGSHHFILKFVSTLNLVSKFSFKINHQILKICPIFLSGPSTFQKFIKWFCNFLPFFISFYFLNIFLTNHLISPTWKRQFISIKKRKRKRQFISKFIFRKVTNLISFIHPHQHNMKIVNIYFLFHSNVYL